MLSIIDNLDNIKHNESSINTKPVLHKIWGEYKTLSNTRQFLLSKKFDGGRTFVSDPEIVNIKNRFGQVNLILLTIQQFISLD